MDKEEHLTGVRHYFSLCNGRDIVNRHEKIGQPWDVIAFDYGVSPEAAYKAILSESHR
jgi:hypothetical protein